MEKQIILHQVNCKGVMGAGFAKYVKDVYPECYQKYRKLCLDKTRKLMGTIFIYYGENDIIINMFSQDRYGRDKKYTDYIAMEEALQRVRQIFPTEKITAPYMIGCGLAGGNWQIVSRILKQYDIEVSKNIILKGAKK